VTYCPICRSKDKLAFNQGREGRLLVFCNKCEAPFDQIMNAFGLQQGDAFPDRPNANGEARLTAILNRGQQPDNPCDRISDLHILEWTERNGAQREALGRHPEKLEELATMLGVSQASLQQLSTGWDWCPPLDSDGRWTDGEGAWTFPERDSRNRTIGLLQRFRNPARDKRSAPGSKRGIYLPANWDHRPGPIYIPEGASDVAALLSAGKCAIGRPSAKGGAAYLVALLREHRNREIIVLGENDLRPDGFWPGKEGAHHIAGILTEALGRPVKIMMPPAEFKDIREFLKASYKEKSDVL
jgi:hypothetical protein